MMTSGAAVLVVAPFSRSLHSFYGSGVRIWVVWVQEVVLMVYLEMLESGFFQFFGAIAFLAVREDD